MNSIAQADKIVSERGTVKVDAVAINNRGRRRLAGAKRE
jgi:hypothetical protein